MNVIVFVAREQARTWLHELHLIAVEDDGEWSLLEGHATSSFNSPCHLGPSIMHAQYCFIAKEASDNPLHWLEVNRNGNVGDISRTMLCDKEDIKVVYLDRLSYCPYCGISHVGEKDGVEEMDAIRTLHTDASFVRIATVLSLAKKHETTRPFYYRLCDQCRSEIRRDPTVEDLEDLGEYKPISIYRDWRRRSFWASVASTILDKAERKAWLETKMACRGVALCGITAEDVRKSITRRLNRKRVTKREQEVFTMLMAGNKIAQMIQFTK